MPTGIYIRSKEYKRKLSISLKGHKCSKKTKDKIAKKRKEYLCSHPMPKGPNSPYFKGIQKHSLGYILIYQPSHPRADKKGYVKRSYLVVEKYLGRYLKPKEIVHHINKIVNDDRIENLKLFATNGKHLSFENKLNKWAKNYDKCIHCGTTEIKHNAKGLCKICYRKLCSFQNSLKLSMTENTS